MALSAETLVAYPADKVFATLTDKAFLEHTSALVGGTLDSFELSGDPSGTCTATIVRSVPTDRLPDIARKVVGATLKVTQVENWGAPSADGSRTAQISVDVAGVPVTASATETLRSEGDKTTITVEGQVKSSIPFLGPKIASAAEPMMAKALNIQATQAGEWIAGH